MGISAEIINKNFGLDFKAVAYNNMKVAFKAFNQFIKQNSDFFIMEKKTTVFGHLLTYAVEQQFCESVFTTQAKYSVSLKEVNAYKYKTLCIETEDFILNIGRTKKPTMLLPDSEYKKEFAKANKDYNLQMRLDISEEKELDVINPKKYAVLSYGNRMGDLTHFRLNIPNSEYSEIIYTDDLKCNVSEYENYVPEELVEESVVRLKKTIEERGII